jgi:hypothetical protein
MRTLHSEFFSDPLIKLLDPWERLFFQGTWCFADDFGRGRAIMRELAGFIFPHDDEVNVRPYFNHLVELGRIHVYTDKDASYYHSPTWYKYQKPNRPTRSKLPHPTLENCPGCRAMFQAGKPFIDRLRITLDALDLHGWKGDQKATKEMIDRFAALYMCHPSVSHERLLHAALHGGSLSPQHSDHGGFSEPFTDALTNPITDGLTEFTGSLNPAARISESANQITESSEEISEPLMKKIRQEVGSRNQEVGSRNDVVVTREPAHVSGGGDETFASGFGSLDEVPAHVPIGVARRMVADSQPIAERPAPLAGLGALTVAIGGYAMKPWGLTPPEWAVNATRQMVLDLGITCEQAMGYLARYKATGKTQTVQAPASYFGAVFKGYVGADAALEMQPKPTGATSFSEYL